MEASKQKMMSFKSMSLSSSFASPKSPNERHISESVSREASRKERKERKEKKRRMKEEEEAAARPQVAFFAVSVDSPDYFTSTGETTDTQGEVTEVQ